MTIAKQINQTETPKILRGLVKLTYVHGRRGNRFTITKKKYKRESTKSLEIIARPKRHLKLKIQKSLNNTKCLMAQRAMTCSFNLMPNQNHS